MGYVEPEQVMIKIEQVNQQHGQYRIIGITGTVFLTLGIKSAVYYIVNHNLLYRFVNRHGIMQFGNGIGHEQIIHY